MADRYFSPAEVEKLIPVLTRIMNDVMNAAREAGSARERRETERQRIALAGGGVLDRGAWVADTKLAEQLTRRGPGGLRRGAGLGGPPNDPGRRPLGLPPLA